MWITYYGLYFHFGAWQPQPSFIFFVWKRIAWNILQKYTFCVPQRKVSHMSFTISRHNSILVNSNLWLWLHRAKKRDISRKIGSERNDCEERAAVHTERTERCMEGRGEMMEKLWGSCGERDEKKSRACQFHKEVKLKREIGFILTAKWALEGLEWQDTFSENQREKTSSSHFSLFSFACHPLVW